MEDETNYAKSKWAETLGLSTSGYYIRLHERDTRVERKDQLRPHVLRIVKEGKRSYGAEKICALPGKEGQRSSFGKRC